MANMDHSSEEVSMNSKEENSTTEETKAEFSEDEENLIARMYSLLGQRWSLIAGRIPGRTADEIEKYCRSRYSTSSE